MRLTFINQFYTPDLSPTAHLCASLAEYRAGQGDDVTVICGRGGYMRPTSGGRSQGVRVVRVWTAQLGSRSVVTRLIDWLTFHVLAICRAAVLPRQDVIVCLTTPPYIVLAGILQKIIHPRTRLVLWNMDCYPEAAERTGMMPSGGIISDLLRAINRAIFRRLDHLICLDSAMKELLLSQYAPPDRDLPCDIIPNWERLSLFPAHQQVHPAERASAALGGNDAIERSLAGRFVVLYLGNAGYGHEFSTIVEAAERLRDEPVTFLFVGGGAMREWIRNQAQSRGLTSFLFLDYVPKEQTPAVMVMADCALITLENCAAGVMSPSKLHSNLAMGLPILYVGPPRTNVDEAIERFGCGVRVRPGEVDRAAAFIFTGMRDREAHRQLKTRARLAFDTAYCDRETLPKFDAAISGSGRQARAIASSRLGNKMRAKENARNGQIEEIHR